jgi:hypothetical protein
MQYLQFFLTTKPNLSNWLFRVANSTTLGEEVGRIAKKVINPYPRTLLSALDFLWQNYQPQ